MYLFIYLPRSKLDTKSQWFADLEGPHYKESSCRKNNILLS